MNARTEIKIDGVQHKIDPSQTLKVRDIFLLGDKPENDLENYELIRVMPNSEDVLFSASRKPDAKLSDDVPVKDGYDFEIKRVSFSIVVNAKKEPWNSVRISYEEVIVLAFGTYKDDENVTYVVNYFNGINDKEGSLTKGREVEIRNEISFTATVNDKS